MKDLFLISMLPFIFIFGVFAANLDRKTFAMDRDQPTAERWWCDDVDPNTKRCRNKEMVCYIDTRLQCIKHRTMVD